MGNKYSVQNKVLKFDSKSSKKRNEVEQLKYYLPNFEKDTDIMIILHFLNCYLFQSIFSAPVNDKLVKGDHKVLDVGCGPGTWLLDLATFYNKKTLFIGVDLVPTFPKEIKPDNVEFKQGDVLKSLPYGDNTFDFVHQGNMLSVFTLEEWNHDIQELIRVCKPGGYIEFTEPELSRDTGPILSKFYDALIELSVSRNVKLRISKEIIRILESLPTVQNVEHKASQLTLGVKGGNIGQAYMDVHDGFFLNKPMPETMCILMGLSQEEYLKLFDDAKNEVNESYAPKCELYRVWCQKK